VLIDWFTFSAQILNFLLLLFLLKRFLYGPILRETVPLRTDSQGYAGKGEEDRRSNGRGRNGKTGSAGPSR
jgi:F-type H+-transporting ATPase subunit b